MPNLNSKSSTETKTEYRPAPKPSRLEERSFLLLSVLALAYAFVCGLHTIADPDLFWQLATGRWVAQHHQVFSTDVFSYTAAGNPWVYPVGSGLLFYWSYLVGGYSLLSWIGVTASVVAVALLLRRGSAITAAITIFVVPLIAKRTAPRAEMFTVVLFAAYLSLLWENYRTGRARLWLLPILMLAWVNLHLGFVSGLGLIAAFVGIDVLQMFRPGDRRSEAIQRLKRACPWFIATAAVTVANPWGWNIYSALIRQNRAMAEHSAWIAEWGRLPLTWSSLFHGLTLSSGGSIYVLLLLAAVAVVLGLSQREIGAAILLICSAYATMQHLRMEALTAIVLTIVGGSILTTALRQAAAHLSSERTRTVLAVSATAAVAALVVIWSANVFKFDEMALSSYGVGLSWWLPNAAAEFIQQNNVPTEIFNTYNEGGFVTWALGPKYRDYFDGRAIPFGRGAFLRQGELASANADSATWDAEVSRYNINTILLPLNRFESELDVLRNYCSSTKWRPVYLDEVSGVFVRRTPQNEALIRSFDVNCATAPLPRQIPVGPAMTRFNQWANAGIILAALGRNYEALAAVDKADQIVPDSSFVPWLRGNIYYLTGRLSESEGQYQLAVSRNPDVPLFWFSLAAVYKHQGRIPETIQAQQKAISLSTLPKPSELLKLARLYLDTHQPEKAIETFSQAESTASPELLTGPAEHNVKFQVDQGQAAAWKALGDSKRAAEFDQKAVQDLLEQNQASPPAQ
jgi:tetratricopeptide (TPR) repeat protein